MQILLGRDETLIKIKSISIKIGYIQNFIDMHFKNTIIKDNYILIPSSRDNSLERSFLLKWIYTLYTKKTNHFIPKLKEALIDRQKKPIRIVLAKETIHTIEYSMREKEAICIKIFPYNKDIVLSLKNYFMTTKLQISSTHISVIIRTDKEKFLLHKLLHSTNIIPIAHVHLYKYDILNFLKKKVKIKVPCPIQKAHFILGSNIHDDTKSLKRRYKKLAMIYHPDKAALQDDKIVRQYTEKFQNIFQAYELLLDKVS